MKLKSLILAAAGLLVLASAVDPPISPQYTAVRDAVTSHGEAVGVTADFSVDNHGVFLCYLNCALPQKACVKECGGGGSCEHQCNCKLFSHPNQLCRQRKCVQPPTKCLATKRDTQEQPVTVIQNSSGDSSALTSDGSPRPDGIASWPLQHCYYCMGTIWTCKNKCTNPGTCDDTCNCYALNHNSEMCNGCDITCKCGHTCPRSEFEQLDLDTSTKRDIQAGPLVNPCVLCKAAVDACIHKCGGGDECELSCKCNLKGSNPLCAECGSVHCGIDGDDAAPQDNLDTGQATIHQDASTASFQDTWPPTAFTPCDRDIAACQKNCANPHACDDACNCYHRRYNAKCKNLAGVIPCHCGHTCPRLEPVQRRLATLEADGRLPEQNPSTALELTPAIPPPPNRCVLCLYSINDCKKKCLDPGTCDDSCDCDAQLHNRNCKNCQLPKCKQSRLTNEADLTPTARDDPMASEIAVAVNPLSNQCIYCIESILSCNKKCANVGACDDTCNCYAQRHNLNCWSPKNCGLPKCRCGHTCPRLQPLQRRLAIGAVPDLTDAPDALLTEKAADIPFVDDDSEVQSGITPAMPFTPGTTCLKAISKCKAACTNPPACDDTCNCYYKGSRDCKSVKLPECKCGHTCPKTPWH